jgi:hypothetical protein
MIHATRATMTVTASGKIVSLAKVEVKTILARLKNMSAVDAENTSYVIK